MGSQILRYRLSDQTFLAPFEIGKTVGQLDLAPGGAFLVAATPNSLSGTNVGFAHVNLSSGTVSDKWMPRSDFWAGSPVGSASIALDSTGAALVAAQMSGTSLTPPLWRYDFQTDTTTLLGLTGNYLYKPLLSASGDRSRIGVAEIGNDSGPFDSYDVGGSLTRLGTTGTANAGVAVNSNGSQFTLMLYLGSRVYAGAQKIKTLGNSSGERGLGAAYHPTQSRLYLAWKDSTQVRVYDSNSFLQLGAFDFETTWSYGLPTPRPARFERRFSVGRGRARRRAFGGSKRRRAAPFAGARRQF